MKITDFFKRLFFPEKYFREKYAEDIKKENEEVFKTPEEEIKDLKEKLAKLESQMSSSWAFCSRSEYEKDFKVDMKKHVNYFMSKNLVVISLLITGIGALIIKTSIDSAIETKIKHTITKIENNNKEQEIQMMNDYNWMNYHNYGKNYIYLADIIHKSPLEKDVKKKEIEKCLEKADDYYRNAIEYNSNKSATHWELGQLCFHYPLAFQSGHINRKEAEKRYNMAIALYEDTEIKQGWRADACVQLGLLLLYESSNSKSIDKLSNIKSQKDRLDRIKDVKKECEVLIEIAREDLSKYTKIHKIKRDNIERSLRALDSLVNIKLAMQ